MPTITTTVTSACASGVVTTQTTTQATPEAAVVAKASGNQFPKISEGVVYALNQFQFKNNADMMSFANSYLNGVQGYMGSGGCTQHAFEGTTPNCLVSFFSLDTAKWKPQNDFWSGNEHLVAALGKVESFEASYWGESIPADLDAALQAWAAVPQCKGFINCTDMMTTFSMRKVDNDSSKIVLIGFHDCPNDKWDDAIGDFTDFAKQHSWSHSFGKTGHGQYLVLQIFENSAALSRQGATFTPWLQSGAGPKCAEWVSESKITHYAVGGIDDDARAIMQPYADGPNFTHVYPALIGGVGGEGRGLSNIQLFFPSRQVAAGAMAEWKGLFAAAKAKGAKVEGSLSTIQGNDTTINVFCHYETVADCMAMHQEAYNTPSFMANCAKKLLHCNCEFFGSMTYELQKTFCGWESLGTCNFPDSLNQQVMTNFFAEQPGDSPVESVQWFETKGDIAPFTTFFNDPKVQANIAKHRASFYIQDFGGENVKLYFKFASSQSFADFWTEAEGFAGEKLTALVEQGTVVNLWIWGELNDAGWGIMNKYGGLPTYWVNGDNDTVTTPFAATRC